MPASSFTVSRDQIIQSALRKLGVLEIGDTPDATTIANAALVLNLFIKQMATEGLKLWTIDEGVLEYTAGQTMYVLGGADSAYFYNATDPLKIAVTNKPLKIIQAFLRNTSVTPNIDIPMQLISKQEYNILGSKFSTGISNTVFYDVRQNSGNLYIFLTPNANTTANYELHFVYQRPVFDVTAASSIPEFPNEWMNTLVWNLADQLAVEYSCPMNVRQEIAQRALAYREQLTDWDVESTSSFFQPDVRGLMQGYGNVVN